MKTDEADHQLVVLKTTLKSKLNLLSIFKFHALLPTLNTFFFIGILKENLSFDL